MAEPVKERYVESPENQNQADSQEELDNQVQRAQEQLLQLKRQQEMIERQKRELEELSRKQEELERGRAEMIEKLSRSMVTIERETYEAEKRVEQLRATNAAFLQHLDVLERINPKNWSNADLHKELSKALSSVDDARTEFNKSITKINAKADQEIITPATMVNYDETKEMGAVNFWLWLKRGLAFTLPLIVFGIIALVITLCLR
jgi:chromosome condensin MukBEF ATPase and DNA-binding subunit MukB